MQRLIGNVDQGLLITLDEGLHSASAVSRHLPSKVEKIPLPGPGESIINITCVEGDVTVVIDGIEGVRSHPHDVAGATRGEGIGKAHIISPRTTLSTALAPGQLRVHPRWIGVGLPWAHGASARRAGASIIASRNATAMVCDARYVESRCAVAARTATVASRAQPPTVDASPDEGVRKTSQLWGYRSASPRPAVTGSRRWTTLSHAPTRS